MPQLRVETVKPEDLARFVPQQSQSKAFLESVDWNEYFKAGAACSFSLGPDLMAFAGIVTVYPRCGECWCLLSQGVNSKNMLRLFRSFLSSIESSLGADYDRIQCTVESGFEPGVRMARMLGMEMEGLMKSFPEKGKSSYLYARAI